MKQFQNLEEKIKKYHTVGTAPKSRTNKKYYTVATVPKSRRKKKKNTTLLKQFQNLEEKIKKIPHCWNCSKI